jgi:hypothetical protein
VRTDTADGTFRNGLGCFTQSVEAVRVALRDVRVAEELAHHGTVLGLGQAVIVAAPRAAAREFDAQLVQHVGHAVVDVLAADIGVEPEDVERELRRASARSRQQCAPKIICTLSTTCHWITQSIALMWYRPLMPSCRLDGRYADEARAVLGRRRLA